mmetsp:Transcript_4674/g.10244  ORF Transcript_4674/g.10244 Transcript_4674/m.10244 type:complete len:102 (+) Transcript_4674:1228-1533(+)
MRDFLRTTEAIFDAVLILEPGARDVIEPAVHLQSQSPKQLDRKSSGLACRSFWNNKLYSGVTVTDSQQQDDKPMINNMCSVGSIPALDTYSPRACKQENED